MKPQYLTAPLLTGLMYFLIVSGASAAGPGGCEYKRQQVERQIDYARAHNNTHRVAGLQEALREINVNCTDNGLLEKKKTGSLKNSVKSQSVCRNWNRPERLVNAKKLRRNRKDWMRPWRNWMKHVVSYPTASHHSKTVFHVGYMNCKPVHHKM